MPVIYWRRWPGHAGNGHFSPIERNPTMNRRNGRVTTHLLSRRTAALKRHLGDATNGDAKGVHQSRVASRRLREALPVLTSGVKGTKAKKALGKIRRLTKALGTVRELDVTLELLDELTVRDTLPRPALEAVRAHVVNERERRRAVMLKRLAHVNVGKLEKRLADAAAVLAGSDSHEWRDALGSRLVRRAKALTSAIGEAGQLYAAEPLHQVRIAAKKLRYAMELAGDAGVKAASAPLRAVKRVQDTLGRLHDLQVLQTHVSTVQAMPDQSGLPPDGGLQIVARALEDECRHLHARYVAAMPRLTEVVQATRTVVVPQLARVRPAPPLKMALKARVPRVAASER
jgi:CHAD domain-containing protein